MRGDPPSHHARSTSPTMSTPHARGSTRAGITRHLTPHVYPACAGIHLSETLLFMFPGRLPRMRGDPPSRRACSSSSMRSTPHARGSTLLLICGLWTTRVYPACAGIHPREGGSRTSSRGLPRMRGDPPCLYFDLLNNPESTPHARGSTAPFQRSTRGWPVYPACAGIHLV